MDIKDDLNKTTTLLMNDVKMHEEENELIIGYPKNQEHKDELTLVIQSKHNGRMQGACGNIDKSTALKIISLLQKYTGGSVLDKLKKNKKLVEQLLTRNITIKTKKTVKSKSKKTKK